MPIILSLHVCSFCFHTMKDSQHMIAGPVGVSICDECVQLCSEIIAEAKSKEEAKEVEESMKKPTEPTFENDIRWVWQWNDGSYSYGGNYSEKPSFDMDDGTDWKGRWVRVRFVEVKS